MAILAWIPSDWLTPRPDRGDSSPFYPWPEDWLVVARRAFPRRCSSSTTVSVRERFEEGRVSTDVSTGRLNRCQGL